MPFAGKGADLPMQPGCFSCFASVELVQDAAIANTGMKVISVQRFLPPGLGNSSSPITGAGK